MPPKLTFVCVRSFGGHEWAHGIGPEARIHPVLRICIIDISKTEGFIVFATRKTNFCVTETSCRVFLVLSITALL